MHIVCIFPVTNNIENTPQILTVFKEEIVPKIRVLGADNIDIKFAGTDYTFVGLSSMPQGQPKGTGVLECLKNVSGEPDYVIMCDGSGKIPYRFIVDVFRFLVSDSSVHCVMANRGENKAISRSRYLIERWEVFALKTLFGSPSEIPDGQCGLWGYYAKEISISKGKTERICLTATSYDIELDLLSEVLSKKLNYIFVPIELPKAEAPKTGFTFEDNIKKMRFLLEKYPALRQKLKGYLEEYKKANETKIEELDESENSLWSNYCNEISRLV